MKDAAGLKRRTDPVAAARLLSQHGFEEDALVTLIQGSQQMPSLTSSGASASSSATAPMLLTTWDLLRSTLRSLLRHGGSEAAGRVRRLLEDWSPCPDLKRRWGDGRKSVGRVCKAEVGRC